MRRVWTYEGEGLDWMRRMDMVVRDVSDKVMARVSAEIERVVSASKFKWRRVSAVPGFLPGYGRVTASDFRLNRQITVDQSSQGKCSQSHG
ncbi:hypothetical protein J1N35_014180 [Gossypium stocksii]|uniref:Uncharacterized protein n=1 Tax=Gossypium stocksii TaxID=47602 RepID=A0A9D3VWH5_9ROSI|nr:hypothetical protein J1N35_014180 [Gossypium stocksii]